MWQENPDFFFKWKHGGNGNRWKRSFFLMGGRHLNSKREELSKVGWMLWHGAGYCFALFCKGSPVGPVEGLASSCRHWWWRKLEVLSNHFPSEVLSEVLSSSGLRSFLILDASFRTDEITSDFLKRIRAMSYETADSQKKEFRKYLEQLGNFLHSPRIHHLDLWNLRNIRQSFPELERVTMPVQHDCFEMCFQAMYFAASQNVFIPLRFMKFPVETPKLPRNWQKLTETDRKNGIISQLTRVLVGLYEEPERPANACAPSQLRGIDWWFTDWKTMEEF